MNFKKDKYYYCIKDLYLSYNNKTCIYFKKNVRYKFINYVEYYKSFRFIDNDGDITHVNNEWIKYFIDDRKEKLERLLKNY